MSALRPMAYVVGVDLSPTRVAIAIITKRANGTLTANASSFTSRAPAGAERIADLAGCSDRAICTAQLVVIAPAGGPAADLLRRAVLAALARRGVPVAELHPREHLADLAELWPGVALANAGEVAALHLAHLGALREGWPVPALDRVAEAVAG